MSSQNAARTPFGAFLFLASAVATQRLAPRRIVWQMCGHSPVWSDRAVVLGAQAAAEEQECIGLTTFLCFHDSPARHDKGASTLTAGRW